MLETMIGCFHHTDEQCKIDNNWPVSFQFHSYSAIMKIKNVQKTVFADYFHWELSVFQIWFDFTRPIQSCRGLNSCL